MAGTNGKKAYQAWMAGRAGEYAVAAQLILRGTDPYFPAIDSGVDLMTAKGCRIQVKSAHLNTSEKMIAQHGEGTYSFMMSHWKRIPTAAGTSALKRRMTPSQLCDVFVFWGIDQNRFWVVPSSIVDKTQIFVLGRPNPRRFVGKIEDVRQMRSLGYTTKKIADHYNVERSLISMLLHRKGFVEQKLRATQQARLCENAWQHITDFVPGAPQVVETPEQTISLESPEGVQDDATWK